MYRIIQSAKVAVCDETNEVGIIIGDNVYNIGGQADWNALEGEPGHVLNRTHYAFKPFEDMVYPGKPGYSDLESVDLSVLGLGVCYKISDYVMTQEEALNCTATNDGDTFFIFEPNEDVLVENLFVVQTVEKYGSTPYFMVLTVIAPLNAYGVVFQSAGTYFLPAMVNDSYKITISPNETVKKLDEKYLPGATVKKAEFTNTGSLCDFLTDILNESRPIVSAYLEIGAFNLNHWSVPMTVSRSWDETSGTKPGIISFTRILPKDYTGSPTTLEIHTANVWHDSIKVTMHDIGATECNWYEYNGYEPNEFKATILYV